ncbi:hypothetical protein [Gimesia chilikensis]|nr:hypothetical protein [Gimesia chilikensis]
MNRAYYSKAPLKRAAPSAPVLTLSEPEARECGHRFTFAPIPVIVSPNTT